MSAVRSAFKGLTREQQAVIKEKRISGERSPDEWLVLLGPVADFDSQADAAARGGAGFFARRFARRHRLPPGLRSFAMPLLPILREDQDPATPLELRIDLTGAMQNHKHAGQSEPYKSGRYTKIVDTFYDDPWIEGHARFIDGADLRFTVTDHMRQSKKRKRSSSGKIKFKTKAKKKTELAVTVSFPGRNYQAGKETGRGGWIRKQSVKAGEDRTVVRLSRVIPTPNVDEVPDVESLLQLVGAAYERVDPLRRKKL
jgi:hypothetical protein